MQDAVEQANEKSDWAGDKDSQQRTLIGFGRQEYWTKKAGRKADASHNECRAYRSTYDAAPSIAEPVPQQDHPKQDHDGELHHGFSGSRFWIRCARSRRAAAACRSSLRRAASSS